jgi:hypothetical protein
VRRHGHGTGAEEEEEHAQPDHPVHHVTLLTDCSQGDT